MNTKFEKLEMVRVGTFKFKKILPDLFETKFFWIKQEKPFEKNIIFVYVSFLVFEICSLLYFLFFLESPESDLTVDGDAVSISLLLDIRVDIALVHRLHKCMQLDIKLKEAIFKNMA